MDWRLLFYVWLFGLGCGALIWYRVLKHFDNCKNNSKEADQKRQ
jgi:hypothetical protein